jgi:hypothetical protein
MTSFPSDSTLTADVARKPSAPPAPGSSYVTDLQIYFGRFGEFDRTDWLVYVSWVGLMVGLAVSTGSFLGLGHAKGVSFPAEAWLVPIGAVVFSIAIAIDTIGHRTVYKEVLKGAEGLVHHVTIACGIGSCVLLSLAFRHPALWVPAMVLTVLSFVYSLVDEVFHWHRYATRQSDRIEMWSHALILVGHGIMMVGWWRWFFLGYPGVDQTVRILGAS